MGISSLFSGRRISGLDGLRALSILLVIGDHSLDWPTGRLGVNAFFVLSGFLITWLLIAELRASGGISLKDFYLRRAFRIFPAYYLFLLIVTLIELLQGNQGVLPHLLPASFYLLNYHFGLVSASEPSLQHLWSLALEEQFYLCWPLVFVILARGGLDRVTRGLIAIIAAVVIWRCWLWFGVGVSERYIYRALDTRFDAIGTGCLLALLIANDAFRRSAERVAALPMILPVSVLLLTGSIALTLRFPDYGYSAGFTLDAVLLAFILLQCVAQSDGGWLGWLNSRPLVFIGSISYPMYLYHEIGAGIADKTFDAIGRTFAVLDPVTSSGVATALAGLLATIMLAWSSWRLVERPMLALRRRLAGETPVAGIQPG